MNPNVTCTSERHLILRWRGLYLRHCRAVRRILWCALVFRSLPARQKTSLEASKTTVDFVREVEHRAVSIAFHQSKPRRNRERMCCASGTQSEISEVTIGSMLCTVKSLVVANVGPEVKAGQKRWSSYFCHHP